MGRLARQTGALKVNQPDLRILLSVDSCKPKVRPSRDACVVVSGSAAMISIDRMTDEDFERHALAIFQRELGLDGLARFLRINLAGSGDYTRDRHKWLNGVTIDDIMEEVASRQNHSPC